MSNAGPDVWPALLSTVSAIAAMISAFAAVWAVKTVKALNDQQIKNERPYFVAGELGFKKLPGSSKFRLMFRVTNTGKRPSKNLRMKAIFIADQNKDGHDACLFPVSECEVAQEIPPNSPTPWYFDAVKLPQNHPPCLIFFGIVYDDIVGSLNYRQQFFMKWDGITNGDFYPDFTYATPEQGEYMTGMLLNKEDEYF